LTGLACIPLGAKERCKQHRAKRDHIVIFDYAEVQLDPIAISDYGGSVLRKRKKDARMNVLLLQVKGVKRHS